MAKTEKETEAGFTISQPDKSTYTITLATGDSWTSTLADLMQSLLPASLNDYLDTCPADEARDILLALADTANDEIRRLECNRQLAVLLAEEMPDAEIYANGVLVSQPANSQR